MLDRASVQVALEADLAGGFLQVHFQLAHGGLEVTRVVEHRRHHGAAVLVMGCAHAIRRISHQIVAQVELTAHDGPPVRGLHIGPVRVEQGVGLGRFGHGHAGSQVDTGRQTAARVHRASPGPGT